MRIDTLLYIKELLEAEVANREEELKKAQRELSNRKEALNISCWDNSDEQTLELRNRVEKRIKLLCEARNALDDFTGKEWS